MTTFRDTDTTTTYEGLVYDLDEKVYHSLPGLASTGAKKILRSPAHYKHYVENPHETKASFDLGSAVHAKVLGVGSQVTVYPDGNGPETYEYIDDDGEPQTATNVLASNGATSTKLSKQFAEEARQHGLIPVKRVEFRTVNKIAESVLREPTARRLLEGGRPEVSMFATDPITGLGLRGRIDYLGARIADLKTTAGEASESSFSVHAFKYGYDVQYGLYEHEYQLITGDTLPWLWIVVETEAPYVTAVHTLSDDTRDMGRKKARVAIDRLARAYETGEWPGYANAGGGPIGIVRPPMFSIVEYQDLVEGDAA